MNISEMFAVDAHMFLGRYDNHDCNSQSKSVCYMVT